MSSPPIKSAGTPRLAIDGGTPVRAAPWPTYEKGDPFIGSAEEAAAMRVLRSGLLFRYDSRPHAETEVGQFESALREFSGSAHALAVSSGTAALALSLMAAGIGPGSQVACPVFTFAATPSAILLAGATPVLVPVDQDLHIDLESFAAVLPSVDAAIVVHMRGSAEDMDALMSLADDAGIPVFEDAVPALGVRLRGRLLGTFGLTGSFSSQSDKSINTGEGGFILTDDPDLAARATVMSGAYEGRAHRHFYRPRVQDLDLPLFSMRMDEIRGAIATAQLSTLPDRLERSTANHAEIISMIEDIPGIRPRASIAGADLGTSLMLIISEGGDVEEIARALSFEGIEARALCDSNRANIRAFWNWHFLENVAVQVSEDRLADSARYVRRALDIPVSAAMTAEDRHDLALALDRVARRHLT
jgi:dTDP-4-amino-4,6-dideoxygalactose transaminase